MAVPVKRQFQKGDRVYIKTVGQSGEITDVSSAPSATFPYYIMRDSGMGGLHGDHELELISRTFAQHSHVNLTGAYGPGYSFSAADLNPDLPKPSQAQAGSSYEDERKKRRENGDCEECGKPLPMSIHGLLECPDHPKPLPPGFKQ